MKVTETLHWKMEVFLNWLRIQANEKRKRRNRWEMLGEEPGLQRKYRIEYEMLCMVADRLEGALDQCKQERALIMQIITALEEDDDSGPEKG
jgi:hypothetical protein